MEPIYSKHYQGVLEKLEAAGSIIQKLEANGFLVDLHLLEEMKEEMGRMIDVFQKNLQCLDSLEELGLNIAVYTLVHAWTILQDLDLGWIQYILQHLRVTIPQVLWEPDSVAAQVAVKQALLALRLLDPEHVANQFRDLEDLFLEVLRGFEVAATSPDVVAALGKYNVLSCLARGGRFVLAIMMTDSIDELEDLKNFSESEIALQA